jgi:hypothetical protein
VKEEDGSRSSVRERRQLPFVVRDLPIVGWKLRIWLSDRAPVYVPEFARDGDVDHVHRFGCLNGMNAANLDHD